MLPRCSRLLLILVIVTCFVLSRFAELECLFITFDCAVCCFTFGYTFGGFGFADFVCCLLFGLFGLLLLFYFEVRFC